MHLVLPASNAATPPPPRLMPETSRRPPEYHSSDSATDERPSDDDSGLRYRGDQRRREASERMNRYMREFDAVIENATRGFPQEPPPALADDNNDATNPSTATPPPVSRQERLDSFHPNQNTSHGATSVSDTATRHGNLQGGTFASQHQAPPLPSGAYPLPNQRSLPSLGHLLRRNDLLNQAHPPSANDVRAQLGRLLQRIMTMENEVDAGTVPSAEEISQVRFQLHQMLEEQYQSPLDPHEAAIEAWISRLSSVAMRADQLRTPASNAPPATAARATLSSTTTTASDGFPGQMYLLSSPDGPYGIVMSPAGLSGTQPQTMQSAGNTAIGARAPVARRVRPPMPTFRVGTNVPPTLHQRRSILASIDLMRIVRGLWLFMRLYFFCYLLTDHGTWTRTIFVILSLITAVLSQTSLPQQALSIVWDPIRRHLENLVPLDRQAAPDPLFQRVAGLGNADNNRASNSTPVTRGQQERETQAAAPAPTTTGMLREYAMIVERAIVVFLATLVPGIGERYVTARNTADNAERRGEEPGEEEQDQNDADADNDAGEGARDNQQAEVDVGQH